jgi:hypothetical protein
MGSRGTRPEREDWSVVLEHLVQKIPALGRSTYYGASHLGGRRNGPFTGTQIILA